MLFSTDLDGTLLTETHKVDDYILDGIKKILSKDHYFAICTGRSISNKSEVNFGIDHPNMFTIAKNGAITYNTKGEVINSRPLKKEAVALFMDTFKDELFIRYESITMNYYTYSEQEALDFMTRQDLYSADRLGRLEFYKKNGKFSATKEEILAEDIYKINFSLSDKDLRKRIDDFLDLHKDIYLDAPWGDGFSDITDAGVNKADATRWLVNYLGLKEDDAHVYGDAYNDIELITEFKNSTCPSNALDILKEKAGNVIGNNDDYSVINDMLAKTNQ